MKGVVLQMLRELAASGLTRSECAVKLDYSYSGIVLAGLKHGIEFTHASAQQGPDERSKTMAAMYEGGCTLAQIGRQFGVTRERVRQIIKKRHGMNANSGGAYAKAEAKRLERRARLEAKCLQKDGCTLTQYREMLALGRGLMKAGVPRDRTPRGAFSGQKRNAKARGIGWELTFWQWWTIWQQSGHWEERGRGQGYMMCRYGDVGPYAVGNIYIATGVHNGSVQPNNPYRKDHPDHDEAVAKLVKRNANRRPPSRPMHTVHIGLPKGVTLHKASGRYMAQGTVNGSHKYLGSFKTPEEAHSAYVHRAAPQTGVAA